MLGDFMNVQTNKALPTRVNVRLRNDMAERLDSVSNELGLPWATISALAIAKYIGEYERGLIKSLNPSLENEIE